MAGKKKVLPLLQNSIQSALVMPNWFRHLPLSTQVVFGEASTSVSHREDAETSSA
jgi:hypothetical protein